MKAAVPPRDSSKTLLRWVVAPTDEVLSPISTAIVLAVAAGVLGICVKLRSLDLCPTGSFGLDNHIYGSPFLLQAAVLVSGIVLLQIVDAKWTRAVLVVEGILCLCGYGAWFALWSFAALVGYYWILRVPARRQLHAVMACGLLIACGLVGAFKVFPRGPFMFSVLFCLRLLFYGWYRWQKNELEYSFLDYLVFMLVAPLIFTIPYMMFIPFPERFAERIRCRLTGLRARKVLVHFALAAALAEVSFRNPDVMSVAPHSVALRMVLAYFFQVVTFGCVAHFVVALLLLHGVDDRVPLRSPLLATDYADFWRRYAVHQKDMQVALFFNPALIFLRKRNRYLAITLAVAWAIVVGNTAIHVLARYMYNPRLWVPSIPSRVVFSVISTAVLAATLCLQEWRRRARRPAPSKGWRGRSYVVLCWIFTQAVATIIYNLP